MVETQLARRKWWVAGLLSLLTSGLGQFYNGQVKKAILFYLLPYFLLVIYVILLFKHPSLLLPGGVVILVVSTYVLVDAIVVALKNGGSYRLKRYNKPSVYILIFVVFGLLVENGSSYIAKNHFVQAYKIPAASMEPTLLIGDHLFIDKFSEGAKSPVRGDIAVFVFPENPKIDYIKRVVGLPGEMVELRDKELYINGEPYKETYVVHRDEAYQPGPRDNFGPVEVPKDSYFTLGDNRDRSFDSRFWGFVSKDRIRGVARVIYWSWDGDSDNVRWDRIGKEVN